MGNDSNHLLLKFISRKSYLEDFLNPFGVLLFQEETALTKQKSLLISLNGEWLFTEEKSQSLPIDWKSEISEILCIGQQAMASRKTCRIHFKKGSAPELLDITEM